MVPTYPFVSTTIDIANHVSLCVHDSFYCNPCIYAIVVTAARVILLYMSTIDVSQILGSLDGYATDSFSCNYFFLDPISLETYK